MGRGNSKFRSRIAGYSSRLVRIFSPWAFPESVYFYTFHKCASTLFSSYVLKNIKGLKHIDYAAQLYDRKRSGEKQLTFCKRGYVYGPIRLSTDPEGLAYSLLVTPATKPDFIRDKIAVFFVRDPRDILVSAYYSFGFTHGLSDVEDIRERQQARRKSMQSLSLDEYVLNQVDQQIKYFEKIIELRSLCKRGVILKYEDMINKFEEFSIQLCSDIIIEDEVIRETYKRSRPQQEEDTTSHRRSGQVGGFREKLKAGTIQSLNNSLEEVLVKLEYPL